LFKFVGKTKKFLILPLQNKESFITYFGFGILQHGMALLKAIGIVSLPEWLEILINEVV